MNPYLFILSYFFWGYMTHLLGHSLRIQGTWFLFLDHKIKAIQREHWHLSRLGSTAHALSLCSLVAPLTSLEHLRAFFPEAIERMTICQREKYVLYKYRKLLKLKTEQSLIYLPSIDQNCYFCCCCSFPGKKIIQRKRHWITCLIYATKKEGGKCMDANG